MLIGSLFSGAGGLDMAVQQAFGGQVVWHSEIEPAGCAVLASNYPKATNLGDVSQINWESVLPVDILCGGFPCQDVSTAASWRRQGMRHGNRSGLWSRMAEAISVLRPKAVVIENVRGLLSATAHRNVESAVTALGDSQRIILRAAGAVLGDLADLGYDAQWATTSADSVGAPHGRQRVFVLAHLRGETPPQVKPFDCPQLGETLMPLLPTPSASDVTGGSCDPAIRVEQGHHLQLIDVVRMYGTPAWDTYLPAIERWEKLTRPAPPAAVTSKAGNPNLNADFAEWMMGWPKNWTHVTDQIALFGEPENLLGRSERLKLFGNGVVPQQAAATLSALAEVAAA